MCSYQGGKHRIGKDIANVINKEINEKEYYEPFFGMGSVGRNVKANKYFFSDTNKDLIDFWIAVQNGFVPDTGRVSEERFEEMKKEPSSPQRTFTAYKYGWGGNYFGKMKKAKGKARPFTVVLPNNSSFNHCSYELVRPKNAIIYCDPPYKGTKAQKEWGSFDYDKFLLTVQQWVKDGNIVFISEQNDLPFPIVWQKEIKRNLGKRKLIMEKLYRVAS